MTKTHGLWRFHFEAARARHMRGDAKWWEDAQRVHQIIRIANMGSGGKWHFSIADAVIECARRYARRHGIEYRTARQWNSMCELILSRMGAGHHATRRACLIDTCGANPRVYWSEFAGQYRGAKPIAKWDLGDVVRRAEGIRKARAERIKAEAQALEDSRWQLQSEIWQTKCAVAEINRSIKAAQAAMKERFA